MSKIFAALLAGVAIGILIAPAKGSETRKKIVDGASDLKEDLSDFLHDTAENVKSGLASAESQAKDFLHKTREQMTGWGN